MKRSAQKAFAIGIISLVALVLPGAASAQALVQTIQLLPPGGTGCPALPVQAIAAHIKDGELNSFDVTVANPSYVAVFGQVGIEGIPFRYMTRFDHGGGFLRHHVDIDAQRIGSPLTVSLTLLSSPAGSPTCLSVISFSVSRTGEILAPGVITGDTGTGSASGSTGGTTYTPGTTPPTPSTSPATGSSTTTPGTPSPAIGGVMSRLSGLCEGNGALQLWFLLLAVYIVIAALTALAKPPLAQKSIGLPLALILVPLVLLIGLWIFAPLCRAAGWIPAVSIIVAVAALLVAFREQNPAVKIIPLPAAKPSTNTPAVTKTMPQSLAATKQGETKGK